MIHLNSLQREQIDLLVLEENTIAENADLSGGINYSMRGDSTTGGLGAVLNDSSVMTIGASVAFKF